MNLSLVCLGGVEKEEFSRELEPRERPRVTSPEDLELVGPVYRKRWSLPEKRQLATEKDRQGWRGVVGGGMVLVFRSRITDEWISEAKFREEESDLRRQSIGRRFSSRKGFRPAREISGSTAWQQTEKRRVPIQFIEHLGWVRLTSRRYQM